MFVWRLSQSKYVTDVAGTGARLAGGRWNSKGVAVLYCSSTVSLCALELFIHLDPIDAPEPLSSIGFDIPDDVFAARTSWKQSMLPVEWRDSPAPTSTQARGDGWVKSGPSLVLELPSVVVPSESNFLLNPAHPDMKKVVVSTPELFQFDPRMWKSAGP